MNDVERQQREHACGEETVAPDARRLIDCAPMVPSARSFARSASITLSRWPFSSEARVSSASCRSSASIRPPRSLTAD